MSSITVTKQQRRVRPRGSVQTRTARIDAALVAAHDDAGEHRDLARVTTTTAHGGHASIYLGPVGLAELVERLERCATEAYGAVGWRLARVEARQRLASREPATERRAGVPRGRTAP